MDFYPKFAFLLIEEQSVDAEPSIGTKDKVPYFAANPHEAEDLVAKLGKLLVAKIRAHSGFEPDLLTPEEILKRDGKSLAPIMYRIETEKFIKSSRAKFKIVECRNSTKLVTDWKPRVPDLFISSGHQVVVIEPKESFSPCNDFAYAILRQIKYNWRIRLPRSFFYPDDVCSVQSTADGDLLITPSMPDGEMEFPEGTKNTLQYDILMMLRASCESAMENHLLMRDMRVGKFDKTLDGVASIRDVYRSLQERVRDGKELSLGMSPMHDSELYKLSPAGDTIMAAETLLREFKNEAPRDGSGENVPVPASDEKVLRKSREGANPDEGTFHKLVSLISEVTESIPASGNPADDVLTKLSN